MMKTTCNIIMNQKDRIVTLVTAKKAAMITKYNFILCGSYFCEKYTSCWM